MKPILFTIGPFNVYTFGFLLSVAFLLSTFVIWKYAKDELKEEEYLDAFLATSFIALISARAVYIVMHFAQFGSNVLKYILVRETPGLSLLGGLCGGFIFLFWFAKKNKYDFLHLADLFSLAACLMLVFAKIGQQVSGSGFGKETAFFLGVRIVGLPGRHHPTELYEAIYFLILFVILCVCYHNIFRNKWPKGFALTIFIAASSIFIFLIEFLKEYTVYLYKLSIRQIIALLMLLIVIKPLYSRLSILKPWKKLFKKTETKPSI